jgi:UDP-N-acetylmuramoyl-tripeptide--D-alanyl-D-alanine ligase
MRKLVDLIKLGGLRGGYRIFLRRNYDRMWRPIRQAARIHRRFFLARTRIVVVVGSLGKTTTRRALQAALACPERNFSHSNYGSSLAENLLRVRRGDAHAVLEVGISGPGNMQPHADMIRPDIVVVTAIKSEHNRSFPTLFDTRAEKVKMVAALSATGLAILNGDDPHVRWMATQTRARVIFFGLNPENDVRAADVYLEADGGAAFQVFAGGSSFKLRSRLAGDHMIYPMLAAIAAAHAEKIELSGALARLARLEPENSRMQLLTLPGGIQIFDDSCKSGVESIHAAFDAFARLPAARKILVLGNVEEPTGKERDVYRDLGNRAARFAERVICVGKDCMTAFRAAAVRAGMEHSAITLVGSRIDPVADILNTMLQPGDAVLIKGASTQKFRRIVLQLTGRKAGCRFKYCDVKVRSCDVCPLLNAPARWAENHYVSRYLKP